MGLVGMGVVGMGVVGMGMVGMDVVFMARHGCDSDSGKSDLHRDKVR